MAIAKYMQNRIHINAIFGMTPKVWCEYKSSINLILCVFCCVAFAHVPKKTKIKFDSKGVKCIFIGYYEKKLGVQIIQSYKLICNCQS
jgi:uncharacterized membrane protein